MRVFLIPIIMFLLAIFAPVGAKAEGEPRLYLNELMPDTSASQDKSEWLEIYNPNPIEIDLRGWAVDGKVVVSDQAVTIPAGGYWIITKGLIDFLAEFGQVTNISQVSISLANTSDEVTLTSPNGWTDTVTYTSSKSGQSWERLGPLCIELALNPEAHSLLEPNVVSDESCFAQGSVNVNPIIDIEFSLNAQDWTNELMILGPAKVYFRVKQGGQESILTEAWEVDGHKIGGADILLESFLGRPVTVSVQTATGEYSFTNDKLHVHPRLAITEFMPNPEGVDSGKEWVEIYNPNAFDVSLTGIEVTDQSGVIHTFSESDTIAAKKYVQVTLPKSVLLNCTLDKDCSDAVTLLYRGLVVDAVTYTNSEVGKSWQVGTDGKWAIADQSTPGAANVSTGPSLSQIEAEEDDQSQVSDTGEDDAAPRRENVLAESTVSYKLPTLALETYADRVIEPALVRVELWQLFLCLEIISGLGLVWVYRARLLQFYHSHIRELLYA